MSPKQESRGSPLRSASLRQTCSLKVDELVGSATWVIVLGAKGCLNDPLCSYDVNSE